MKKPSLTAVYTAALAVVIFAGVTTLHAGLTIGAVTVLSALSGVLAFTGSKLGHREPDLSTALMRAWTPFVATLAAGVGAAIFAAALHFAVDDQKGVDKVVAAGFLAAVTLLGEQVTGWLESIRAVWFSKQRICHKYLPLFPGIPGKTGRGWEAANHLRPRCSNFDPGQWTIGGTKETLEKIKLAIDAQEYAGGEGWIDPPPPPPPQARPPL